MTEMILSLFDPNTLLAHRAAIAGLALALAPLSQDNAPLSWEVTEDEVRLAWEGSDREAVEWLVRNTYQIQDGYLNVPALNLDPQGRYTFTQGITSTLLQHGKQRELDSNTLPLQFSIEEGQPEVTINFRPVMDCYYTRDLKDAFNSKGMFKPEIPIKGHHLPGLVECFVNGPYQETPSGFLALLFLPLACGYYRLPNYRSALVIPEVTNLKQWVRRQQKLSGRRHQQLSGHSGKLTTYGKFQASGAGESGLRFLLDETTISDAQVFKVDYCEVYQLGGQAWDTSQRYLKQAVHRVRATDEVLALYESALAFFPPATVRKTDKGETWVAMSKALPWIADNLIARKRWYEGFHEFRKAHDLYERGGLVKMTQNLLPEEEILFKSVQDSFGIFRARQFKARADQLKHELTLDEKFDVAKSSAKKALYRLQRPATQLTFAQALVEFLSQFPGKTARGNGLEIYAWLHSDENWRKAKDLALLAIATYQSKDKADPDNPEAELAIALDPDIETETEGLEMDLV